MRKVIIGISATLVIIASFFFIKIENNAPDNTRVIAELERKTYITPPCFEQANASNYIDETTLEEARKLGLKADSPCTEKSLTAGKMTVMDWLLVQAGIKENHWNW